MFVRSIAILLALLLTIASSINAASMTEKEKIKKLDELTAEYGNGYITLTDKSYEFLVGSSRPYHTIILVTASNPRLNCEPCREIFPEFKSITKSWNNRESGKLYFGLLDYQNAKEIFRNLKIKNVPNVLYYKPTKTVNGKPEFYDLQRKGLRAENIMDFIKTKTEINFELEKEIDYSFLVYYIVLGLIMISVAFVFMKNIKEIILNKKTWMVGTMSVIFLMISGFMWVHIRHPPPGGMSKNGHAELFLPGFQQQYSTESQIIIIIYIIIAFSVLVLSDKVNKLKSDSQRRIVIYGAMGTLLFFFSLILRIFYIKSQAYPFRLL